MEQQQPKWRRQSVRQAWWALAMLVMMAAVAVVMITGPNKAKAFVQDVQETVLSE